jgi:hypothetical protein
MAISDTDWRPTFAELLAHLHAHRHTGPVIIHFAEGHPNVVEMPTPATLVKLDKRRTDTVSGSNS